MRLFQVFNREKGFIFLYFLFQFSKCTKLIKILILLHFKVFFQSNKAKHIYKHFFSIHFHETIPLFIVF